MRSWVFIALLVALSASATASPDAFASLTVNPVIEADDTPNPAQDLVEQMKQAQAESSKSLEEVDKVGDSALAQFRQTELQSTKQLEAEHKARKEQKRFAKKLAKLKHTERHKLLELQAKEEERLKAERRKMTELEAAQEARAHRIQRLIKLIQKERKRLVKQRQRHVKQVARLSKKLRKHDKKTLHRFQTLMSARERRLEAAIASVNQRNVQLQQQLANLKANADNAVVNKVTADTQRVASVLANVRAEEEKQKQSIDQRVRAVEEAEAQTDSSVVERLSHLTEEQDEAPKAQPKAQEEEEQQEGEEKAEDDATETADQ